MESRNETYIFLHGLGQTAASWDKVFSVLRIQAMSEINFLEMGISKKDALSLTKSMLGLVFRAELSRLTCPIMIICGEKDKANRKAALSMNNKMLNAKLYLIAQTGHEVNIEAPEELANLIEKFWIDNGNSCLRR